MAAFARNFAKTFGCTGLWPGLFTNVQTVEGAEMDKPRTKQQHAQLLVDVRFKPMGLRPVVDSMTLMSQYFQASIA